MQNETKEAMKKKGRMRNTWGTAITENNHKPIYEDTDDLTQALQGLLMSQILEIDDDGADEEGSK